MAVASSPATCTASISVKESAYRQWPNFGGLMSLWHKHTHCRVAKISSGSSPAGSGGWQSCQLAESQSEDQGSCREWSTSCSTTGEQLETIFIMGIHLPYKFVCSSCFHYWCHSLSVIMSGETIVAVLETSVCSNILDHRICCQQHSSILAFWKCLPPHNTTILVIHMMIPSSVS